LLEVLLDSVVFTQFAVIVFDPTPNPIPGIHGFSKFLRLIMAGHSGWDGVGRFVGPCLAALSQWMTWASVASRYPYENLPGRR
jgi:hypothetical protein